MRAVPWLQWALVTCVLASAPLADAQPAKPRAPRKKPPAATAPAVKTPPPEPPEPPPSDLVVHTRYVAGLQVSETTTYFRGKRQRVEFPGLVSITQCDLARTIFLNGKTQRFAVQAHEPADTSPPGGAPPSPPAAEAHGGSAIYTTTLTDTMERKPLFGREARHIKSSTSKDATAATCLKGAERVEVDAWYVDLEGAMPCTPSAPRPAATPACADRVERRTTGAASLGMPLVSTTTATIGDDDTRDVLTSSLEVTSLEVTRVPAALFEVPDGFTQVGGVADLVATGTLADALFGTPSDGTGGVVPKHAGAIRVGVLEPVNRTERTVVGPQARRDLAAAFRHGGIEAVPIAGDDADAVAKLAASLDCDYVLFSEVTGAKANRPGKVGGLLRRATGDAEGESQEVTVAWQLFPLATPEKALLDGSARASSGGGFSVGSAVRLAAFAGSMYLNLTGMGSMMGGLGGSPMGALSGGGTGGFYDPRASALTSLASSLTQGSGPAPPEQALRQALAKAFDDEAQTIGQKLAKR